MKIKDIAIEAGVSPATVSRVINNHKNISIEKREMVLKVINKYNYTPNQWARNLSKVKSNTIALVLPEIKNTHFSTMLDEFNKLCIAEGYDILFYTTNDCEKTQALILDNLIKQKILCIFLLPTKFSSNKSFDFKNEKVPIILLDRKIEGSNLDGVHINNYLGSKNITELLINNGHKDIYILTGPLSNSSAKERLEGFIGACKNNSIEVKEQNIFNGDYEVDSGYKFGMELMNKSKLPSAIYICNNLMTIGFFKAIKKVNFEILDKVSLVVFDKAITLEDIGFEITNVSISTEKMILQAFNLMKERVESNSSEFVKEVMISPEINKKGSEVKKII